MGTNLLIFLVMNKKSTTLLLILSVTFLCLSSKTTFLIDIKKTLIEKAMIGKLAWSISNSSWRMMISSKAERQFSKCKVESMMKYQKPRKPWYLFANIMLVFTSWSVTN